MSAEYLPHLFEEFSREHTSTESRVTGTGLGLPIVKSLVQLMGGTIDVESTVGKGSTFTVVIPFPVISKEELTQQREQPADPAAGLAGKHLLLAEDNDLNAEIALTILQENGMIVNRAEDGIRCLELLGAKPAGYYDAVLMDIQMPRMDGYQAAQAIRALPDARSTVPIIAMTANAFEEDKQRAFDAGMNDHISKPISVIQAETAAGESGAAGLQRYPEPCDLCVPHGEERRGDRQNSQGAAHCGNCLCGYLQFPASGHLGASSPTQIQHTTMKS